MRIITVAFLALLPSLPTPLARSDAAAALWAPVGEILVWPGQLAFDHSDILRDGVERAWAKLEYTPRAAAFCPPEFTVVELRRVYEIVWGTPLDPRNLHRKATSAPGFVTTVADPPSFTGAARQRHSAHPSCVPATPLAPRPPTATPGRRSKPSSHSDYQNEAERLTQAHCQPET